MKLYRFRHGLFGEILSSIPQEELLNRLRQQPDLEFLESTTLKFSSGLQLTISDHEDISKPSCQLCSDVMTLVYQHCCSGTYGWFVDLCLALESAELMGSHAELSTPQVLQFLALVATFDDVNSTPVLLYMTDLLV